MKALKLLFQENAYLCKHTHSTHNFRAFTCSLNPSIHLLGLQGSQIKNHFFKESGVSLFHFKRNCSSVNFAVSPSAKFVVFLLSRETFLLAYADMEMMLTNMKAFCQSFKSTLTHRVFPHPRQPHGGHDGHEQC